MKKRLLPLLLTLALLLSTAAGALTVDQARALLEEHYIAPLPAAAQTQTTVQGLLDTLGDPYTQYFTPEEYKKFSNSMLDIRNVGLGLQSDYGDKGYHITRVYKGSAAQAAGLKAGDLITAIGGKKLTGLTLAQAQALMLGAVDTKVTVKVTHQDGTAQDYTLTRGYYDIPTTEFELIDEHIGYITCAAFGQDTYGHFKEIIKENDPVVDHWIVDLRGNPGGEIQAAVDAAATLAGGGELTYIQDAQGKYSYYTAAGDALTMDPSVVLVDQNTASAAEIFASIIRDRQAGIIVGQRTFGKGIAQVVLDQTTHHDIFPKGDALKITSYRIFSPRNVTHNKVGVLPHLTLSPGSAGPAAYLLSASRPTGDTTGTLRLHLGSWRLYLDLKTAADPYYHPAFVEILESLPAGVHLYLGTGKNGWNQVSAATVAAKYAKTYQNPNFTDLKDSKFADEINTLGTFGIVAGPGDGTFQPQTKLSRAELCALLAQALNYPKTAGGSTFSDVKADAWYTPYINTLSKMGIVNGWDDGLFHPEEPINHEQFMIIMARTAAGLNHTAAMALQEGAGAEILSSAPYAAYDLWARNEVWLLDGLYFDAAEKIAPFAPTTREEAAATLYKTMAWMGILVG